MGRFFFPLLKESIRRAEKGINVYWLCYEHALGPTPCTHQRIQSGNLEANVLFGLHGAKETFQLIANIYNLEVPHENMVGKSENWKFCNRGPYPLWHQ